MDVFEDQALLSQLYPVLPLYRTDEATLSLAYAEIGQEKGEPESERGEQIAEPNRAIARPVGKKSRVDDFEQVFVLCLAQVLAQDLLVILIIVIA